MVAHVIWFLIQSQMYFPPICEKDEEIQFVVIASKKKWEKAAK